jgi:hypothetical protein
MNTRIFWADVADAVPAQGGCSVRHRWFQIPLFGLEATMGAGPGMPFGSEKKPCQMCHKVVEKRR